MLQMRIARKIDRLLWDSVLPSVIYTAPSNPSSPTSHHSLPVNMTGAVCFEVQHSSYSIQLAFHIQCNWEWKHDLDTVCEESLTLGS